MIVIKDHEDFNRHENTGMSVCQKASGLFQLQGIKDNWEVLRKPRFGYNRFHIGLLLVAYTAMVMCIESKFSIEGNTIYRYVNLTSVPPNESHNICEWSAMICR